MTDEELAEAIAQYSPVVSFRVRKSLGSLTPDWEDVAHEIITNVV